MRNHFKPDWVKEQLKIPDEDDTAVSKEWKHKIANELMDRHPSNYPLYGVEKYVPFLLFCLWERFSYARKLSNKTFVVNFSNRPNSSKTYEWNTNTSQMTWYFVLAVSFRTTEDESRNSQYSLFVSFDTYMYKNLFHK